MDDKTRADSERGGIAETGGAERWEGRLNLARIVEERPKSDGLDGGDCDSPFVALAAINQLYLDRAGSSQNLER